MTPPLVVVNTGGSHEGGAGTWVLGLVRELERSGPRDLRWRFLVGPTVHETLAADQLVTVEVRPLPVVSPLRRIAWEQVTLAHDEADVLVAGANFGPVLRRGGYVLVAHNALYYDRPGVRGRMGARLRAETALARASVRRARSVLAPSNAVAEQIEATTGRRPIVSPFGPGLFRERRPSPDGRFTFVHRTHWGPHKRLDELLEAVGLLVSSGLKDFVLESACDPSSEFARRHAESQAQRRRLEDPLIRPHVRFAIFPLGSEQQQVIAGDAVVLPSATESFCFPLAEGLAAGLPIVCADAPFARELCGPAATYVPPADPAGLADAMARTIAGERPPEAAPEHLARLSWAQHADTLSEACHRALT